MTKSSRTAPDASSLLADLIRCPSVTPTEAGVLSYLETVLADVGFDVERLTFSAPGTADVDNLFATIGSGKPHLAFNGHTDVVPPATKHAGPIHPSPPKRSTASCSGAAPAI